MYDKAAALITSAKRCIAFTGAGISVESGVPPFRGENGLWNKYDPATFDIGYFNRFTLESWEAMRTIFYDLFGQVLPNTAHYGLAELEARDLIQGVITQNVDNLHFDAGSRVVHEFHGSLKKVICTDCSRRYPIGEISLATLPPQCPACQGILKPDVVFFGEDIPEAPAQAAFSEARRADCFLLIGTTGSVAPANMIPTEAKRNGAVIIEINPEPSEYTRYTTDLFIREKACAAVELLMEAIDELERS